MDLLSIIREQRANRFRELAGANAAVTLPISDGLLTRLVMESLPVDGPIRELHLQAHADNVFSVRLRLTRPAFLPAISFRLSIDGQPRLPESPFVTFRVTTGGGLMMLAGSAARMIGALPPYIRVEGDRIDVDLGWLLRQHDVLDALDYVQELHLATEPGKFVVGMRAIVSE